MRGQAAAASCARLRDAAGAAESHRQLTSAGCGSKIPKSNFSAEMNWHDAEPLLSCHYSTEQDDPVANCRYRDGRHGRSGMGLGWPGPLALPHSRQPAGK